MEVNESMDYFKWKSGSKQWPSDDPKDSPIDTFVCKLCNWSFSERMCGSFPIGHDVMQPVHRRIIEHLMIRHHMKIPLKID